MDRAVLAAVAVFESHDSTSVMLVVPDGAGGPGGGLAGSLGACAVSFVVATPEGLEDMSAATDVPGHVVVVVADHDGGRELPWLDRIPVLHSVIFVLADLDVAAEAAMESLSAFPHALYFEVSKEDSCAGGDCVVAVVHRRADFFNLRSEKVAAVKSDLLLEEEEALSKDVAFR